ncbi:hypothetical protein L1987_22523 [Smallanthus sonchifolius]|uniref:Uncharacterized protein n=1 Tax=Smallanthus sonchifolius TaxID=185202 RepID=A0ACB9IGF7_9ASTR|nr:hypothetical protein L1987_22523 [Smallanthus sonchifolius]
MGAGNLIGKGLPAMMVDWFGSHRSRNGAITTSQVDKTGELIVEELPGMVGAHCVPKIYELVDDPSLDEIISWNKRGDAFIIWQPMEFAREVLSKHFKHNNLATFIRQLLRYGFKRIGGVGWMFRNAKQR